jgi:hypothetical protein
MRRQLSPSEEIALFTRDFIQGLAPSRPSRVQARVAGPDGMVVLCAVETALAESLPARPAQELVWLSGAAPACGHRLSLSAYGSRGELLAEVAHELER